MMLHLERICLAAIFLVLPFPLLAQPPQRLSELRARAEALEKKGDAHGSLALWQKAAALSPNSVDMEDHIGFLLAVLNRRDEAIPHFERALEIDSHYAPAHYHLGIAYLLQQDPTRGIPHLQAA
ncbi:MAG TPA: tetratricopeptide repeat protein, partial [Terriglobales bacterium]|nr:tetratricopeptide repeat protein [Terriglobales bacterium]